MPISRMVASVLPVPDLVVSQSILPSALSVFNGYEHTMDSAIYAQDALFPANRVSIGPPEEWRGQQIVQLRLFPIQVNPLTGVVVMSRRLRVQVQFSGGDRQPRQPQAADNGPFAAVIRAAFLNYETAQNWQMAAATAPQLRIRSAPGPWYKVAVKGEGLYALTCTDLANAGIVVNSLDLATVRLLQGGADGSELALRVDDGNSNRRCDTGDRILFWGQGISTKYTDTNYYWLTFGGAAGKRMTQRFSTGMGATVPRSPYHVHLEQALFYRSALPQREGYEHWYGDAFTRNLPAYPATRTYTMTLDGVSVQSTGSVTITMGSYAGDTHAFRVEVNNNTLNEYSWSGLDLKTGVFNLPAGVLVNGANTIRITHIGSTNSGILLDVIDLVYNRNLRAISDTLAFTGPGGGERLYSVSGFSNASISIFDITDPTNVVEIPNPDLASPCPCTASFGDDTADARTYYALAAGAERAVASITLDTPSDLRATTNGADYILIVHPSLLAAVAPLAAHRETQGLRVATVSVQDIYDEFNGGVVEMDAIRDFLAYAYANWQRPAPTYVLLVGDGTFDPRGYCVAAAKCPVRFGDSAQFDADPTLSADGGPLDR